MKTIFVYIAIAASWLGLMTACNSIDPEERFIDVAPAKVQRAVLLEDFTAQKCIYCPAATEEIHRLQEAYGEENVIAVAIHGTALAISENNSSTIGLKNAESSAYVKDRGVNTLPSVFVNRQVKSPNNAALGELVSRALSEQTPVTMLLDASIDGRTGQISIETNIRTSENVDARLQLWVVEDSIKAIQLFPQGVVKTDYLHQHVFRQTVNGMEGEAVNMKKQQVLNLKYALSSLNHWNKTHLSIVAFVYNESGVLQVVRKKISEKS